MPLEKKKKKKTMAKDKNVVESSSQPLPSENDTVESLKPLPGISKKVSGKKRLKKNNARSIPPDEETSEPAGAAPQNSNEKEVGKEPASMNENEPTNVTDEEHASESQQNKRKKQKVSWKEQQKQNTDKDTGLQRSLGNQFPKSENRNMPNDNNREKLGGLIFMCNAKTKPDCFRYHVMGVSISKKDIMLGVRPGLKLFLYDYDLKLMYGIYKASSAGGMKLEPSAFGGAFPAQVRFVVHEDCYPLPESIFKKALTENYNQKQKFNTELTVQQVKKLTRLFRPAEIRPSVLPSRSSPPGLIIRDAEHYERARESLPRSYRDPYATDGYVNGEAMSQIGLSSGRDQHIAYREVAPVRKEDFPHEQFLTEKDYRAHGLRSYVAPAEGEHILRQQGLIYSRTPTELRESQPAHDPPPFLREQQYRAYDLGGRQGLPLAYQNDPYAREYGGVSGELYLPAHRREEIALGSSSLSGRRESYANASDGLLRAETDEVERYLRYTSDRLSDYNQGLHHQGVRPDAAYVPVSSRYSFAGPSVYR